MGRKVRFFVTLPEEGQAKALAQLVKRVGLSDCREHATTEEEAYKMHNALQAIRDGLATRGFSPR